MICFGKKFLTSLSIGGVALDELLVSQPGATKELWMAVYGAGTKYGALMPYSRMQESQADHLGLLFMAMAGYDPNQAVSFWQRMAGQRGERHPPGC